MYGWMCSAGLTQRNAAASTRPGAAVPLVATFRHTLSETGVAAKLTPHGQKREEDASGQS